MFVYFFRIGLVVFSSSDSSQFPFRWFLLKFGFPLVPVSYTHLDVYKRQGLYRPKKDRPKRENDFMEIHAEKYNVVKREVTGVAKGKSNKLKNMHKFRTIKVRDTPNPGKY